MSKKIIGIDLGGTSIKFAILTLDGEVQEKWSIKTNILDEGSHIVDDMIESIAHRLKMLELDASEFQGIGMGSPGVVDREKGTVIGAYNLNWKTLQPVKEKIESALHIPFFIDNDANVAALGERWKGAGENQPDVVFMTLGTGVGGGVIIDGKPLCGFNGAAAEIGHLPVADEEKEYCNCGKRGCLEQVASATGIVKTAVRMLSESDEPSALRDIPYISAKAVFDEAKNGDSVALKVVDYMCRYLGKGLACASGMVDTEVICIGGGVSAAGEFLLSRVEKYYKEYVFHASRNTKILKATLGNDAGMYGAARLVLNE